MASASSLLCEEQLLCSICLDVFTEPVSTPCGHNYCKTCITGYWSSRDQVQCPLCKKTFPRKTKLQVNTGFRDMVEHFNSMRVRGEDDGPAKPGEVTCDICLEPKLRAQKTCLVCLASYCQSHLEPHQRVKTLKKHQLIEPVSNLEERVCKKHDKMFEFFCRQEQKCVCFMCLKDDHVTHAAVPLEQEFRERKAQLECVMSRVKTMENMKSGNINEIKQFVKQSRDHSEREIADIVELFAALVASLQRSQAELIKVIQEKQKAAEKEAEDRAEPLKQEVAELRKTLEMEQHLQTEDHLLFLQSCPPLIFPLHSVIGKALLQSMEPVDLSDICQQSYVGKVQKAVAQMEKILSNEMQLLIDKVRSDDFEADEKSDTDEEQMTDRFVEEDWTPPRDKLMMIQQSNEVDVTLDYYTANSRLVVSDDGKQLRFRRSGFPFLNYCYFLTAFQNRPLVLGKEGFSSGRFYYEVRITGNSNCYLGVAKESVDNKIDFLCSGGGVWAVHIYTGMGNTYLYDMYFTQHLIQRPQTVGVFVDYEKGEISFYDVDARTLIYSYTGYSFQEPPSGLRALLHSTADASAWRRPKLYPIFGIFNYEDHPDNMLEITPAACTT